MIEELVEFLKLHANGHENAIKTGELATKYKKHPSEIRRVVNAARCEGYPICAGDKGYFYSDDNVDIVKTINSLKGRCRAIEKSVDGLIKAIS